jgi:hypothetical protein
VGAIVINENAGDEVMVYEYEIEGKIVIPSVSVRGGGFCDLLTVYMGDRGDVLDFRLRVNFLYAVFCEIFIEGLFGLDLESGNDALSGFDAGKVVVVDFGVSAQGLRDLFGGVVVSVDDFVSGFVSPNGRFDSNLVMNGNHWCALHVKQEVDLPEHLRAEGNKLYEGFSTRWASEFQ